MDKRPDTGILSGTFMVICTVCDGNFSRLLTLACLGLLNRFMDRY